MFRDFGSKAGSGGQQSASLANVDRRERQTQLALENIDLEKDPYIMKNHIGKYECKLCLTQHNTIGNYMAHTQGRRHKYNLHKRIAADQKDTPIKGIQKQEKMFKKTLKIGRPGYTVSKKINPETKQKSLIFVIQYPEIDKELQPRFRIMSSYEQKQEPPNPKYQYLLFAADPYETIAFKIPNKPIDRGEGKFITEWDKDTYSMTLKLHFQKEDQKQIPKIPPPSAKLPPPPSSLGTRKLALPGKVIPPPPINAPLRKQ
ncbi:splicing factor 3a, subunit 2 [Naegleria gruberi]|uniref:Splicing factor 3a, subunit 2 n=1 Tax=Naegleria gruberi TaxID=5762 RepID=D2UZL0_NAEGR|nr:splicing factor 3a, subunit 2 [Naegleria gruberi]EFC49961.1 splicing factor 3a, subunit 2 [Naegleria gruberi]|eukprot:XP_002682705.1 splicing factor 3a, subunit 2 [Naegleria gruberi strain NEG-M]